MMKRIYVAAVSIAVALTPVFALADSATSSDPNAGVKAQVQSYFSDIPVMIAIAQCESSFREYTAQGTVLLGGTGTMAGVFQLDENSHKSAAAALGLDIDTTTGNITYARYLYGFEGTTPWFSSYSCWHPLVPGYSATTTSPTSVSATSTAALSINLMLGNVDPQVMTLQKLLNADGFTVASSGPGSAGQETDVFGSFTQKALRGFQCSEKITCSGDEYTTGYGLLNAPTRSALLSYVDASGTTPLVSTPTTTVLASDEAAQIAQLELQIKALTAVLVQLLAARGIHS